jgi:serine/threonine-protein kinase
VAAADDRFIGPYRVLRRIGAGGMGEVFHAYDTRLNRDVAIKSIKPADRPGAAIDPARLRSEARTAARLNHPNIATIYDVVESDEGPCLVMEYVEGETLAQRLTRGALGVDDTTRLGAQLAAALAAAHAHGVVHRDVKPGNIQITPDGRLKLLDLGVAKVLQADTFETTTMTPDTATTERKGTPGYMAPEQLRMGAVGPYTDIYAAGLVLFEMLAGRRVFASRDIVGLAMEMASQPTTDVQRAVPSAPPALCAAIRRSLQLNPSDRFRDGTELAAALAGVTAGPGRRPARRLLWYSALGAVVAAAVAAGVWLMPSAPSSTGTRGPLGLGLLPVLNLSTDERTSQLASALSSLVLHNLDAVPNSAVTRLGIGDGIRSRDREALAEAGALGLSRFLDLALQQSGGRHRLDARLLGSSGEALWRDRFEGDLVQIQRGLLEALARQLEADPLVGRALTPAERDRFHALATSRAGALEEYARGRSMFELPTAAARLDDIIGCFERAVAADDRFAPALASLADAYRVKAQRTSDRAWLDRAAAAAQAAIAADSTRADGHVALAALANAAGRPADAISAYRTAISLQPSLDVAHRQLGRLLADSGRVDEGLQEMTRAIALRPESWSNHYTIAVAYYALARYREAVPHLRRVAELQPDYGAAYSLLGVIHHRMGELSQAVGYYEHATRLDNSAAAYSNLGTAYYDTRRYAEALAAYQKAAGINPTSAVTRRNVGDAHAQLGNATAASAAYEEAVQLADKRLAGNPRDASTLALKALCLAKLGRRAEARRHAAEAVVLSPDDREVVYKQAAVLALVGDGSAALDALRRAIERGYERRMARDDDDLRALRDVPAFRQLTADPSPQ